MLVGADTVRTTEQVDHAMNAGAKFIVSPGLNPKVVKFFPAEAAGGLSMIKSMAAPYTNIEIQANYLDRAIYHLEKRGFVFDESSFKYNDNGELTVAYLKDEIAGLAVHFNQK